MGRKSLTALIAVVLLIVAGCSRNADQNQKNTNSASPQSSEAEIQLTAAQAKAGATASVTIPERRQNVTVHIPPGVTDGTRLRLAGQAVPFADGTPRDFVIMIRVK